MKFLMSSKLKSGKNNKAKGVDLVIDTPKGEQNVQSDVVLLSIGRRPFTGGLQLEKAGLSTNARGQIETNKTW